MYDNINFYLDRSEVGDINLLNEVLENGDNIKIEQKGYSGAGIPFAYISLEGQSSHKLTFKITPYRISIMGKNSSICKYWLGDNFQTLTLVEFNNAITEISNRLGVPIDKANVCRIDVAQNFIMKHSPSTYHSCLIHLPRYMRGEVNGNLYFKTNKIELNFYDKKKEYREKRVKIPDEYLEVENILRYEIRFKRNVSKVFGRKITIEDLRSEKFSKILFEKWNTYYWKITKQNPIVFESETSTFKTKDFKNYFMAKGIESTGGVNYVYKMIDESKKAKTITKHRASYLKSVVNKAYTCINDNSEHDFIEELNSKMESFIYP